MVQQANWGSRRSEKPHKKCTKMLLNGMSSGMLLGFQFFKICFNVFQMRQAKWPNDAQVLFFVLRYNRVFLWFLLTHKLHGLFCLMCWWFQWFHWFPFQTFTNLLKNDLVFLQVISGCKLYINTWYPPSICLRKWGSNLSTIHFPGALAVSFTPRGDVFVQVEMSCWQLQIAIRGVGLDLLGPCQNGGPFGLLWDGWFFLKLLPSGPHKEIHRTQPSMILRCERFVSGRVPNGIHGTGWYTIHKDKHKYTIVPWMVLGCW